MKTTLLILLTIMLSTGTFAISQSEPLGLCKKMPLEKAIQNPHLLKAMYQQIDPILIQNEQNSIYVAKVSYDHVTYIIYGKLEEWISFFLMDPGISPNRSMMKL